MIRRWMVLGGELVIACVMHWRIGGNGFSAVGETAVKVIALGEGSERRLVKSKL